MGLIAKGASDKKIEDTGKKTEMGTTDTMLVMALRGGVVKLDELLTLSFEMPDEKAKIFVEELMGLKNLLGAVERGIATLK